MIKQTGSVLLISLIMLLVLTVVGVASISGVSMTEKMAQAQKDYDIAFEMAEAALVEGENWLDDYAFSRGDLQSSCSGSNCWNSTCTNGLCFNGTFPIGTNAVCEVIPPTTPVWEVKGNWTARAKSYSVPVAAVEPPKYMLEFLCYTPKDPSITNTTPPPGSNWSRIYRVTALAFGPNPDTRVMLQSTYRAND